MKPKIFEMEWRLEPPRTRSVIVGNRPRRVALPQPTAFMITRIIDEDYAFSPSNYPPHKRGPIWLNSWAVNDELTPDTPLLLSPFFASQDALTHVYRSGAVCFGQNGYEALASGMDPVDVFWGSDMRVLPSWLTQVPGMSTWGHVWQAPVVKEHANVAAYYHTFDQNQPFNLEELWAPGIETPQKAMRHLVESLRRGETGYSLGNANNVVVRIRAPWLPKQAEMPLKKHMGW